MAVLNGRLDPARNPLWYEDIRLLKHLTGQDLGPDYKSVDEKNRDAAVEKWRQWAEKNR